MSFLAEILASAIHGDDGFELVDMQSPTSTSPSPSFAAAAGLVSAAVGLGIAEMVTGLDRRLRSPVIAVGDRTVDYVPAFLKEIAISLFGTKDKIALLVGIGAALALYAAVVGVLALRKRLVFGVAGVALFGLVGALAALGDRAGAQWFAPAPAVVGSVAAGLALAAFAGLFSKGSPMPMLATTEEASAGAVSPGRRRALTSLGGFAAGAAVFAFAGRRMQARFNVSGERATLVLPSPARPAASVPAGVQAESAASFITSNADFYRIDTALEVPQVSLEDWSLRVHGMVEQERELSFRDLIDRELVEKDITLTCVSNTIGGELIGTARWLGVRLDDLLADSGIDPAATQIVGRSVDGYTCGFPVAALDGRDALVAIGMNGEPLPLEHGFPARLIVPGIYGYASATKWLSEIELTTFDEFDHYWVPRGYAAEAPIKLQSRIDTPRGLDTIDPGPFVIGGVAWHQPIGIEQVEISIDGGEWQPTTLAAELNGSTWRQWSFPWEATPGRHSITVRATNREGAVQTEDRVEPLPDGATGRHTVVVLVREI